MDKISIKIESEDQYKPLSRISGIFSGLFSHFSKSQIHLPKSKMDFSGISTKSHKFYVTRKGIWDNIQQIWEKIPRSEFLGLFRPLRGLPRS
jgi:hypothetical protein